MINNLFKNKIINNEKLIFKILNYLLLLLYYKNINFI